MGAQDADSEGIFPSHAGRPPEYSRPPGCGGGAVAGGCQAHGRNCATGLALSAR